MIPRVRTEPRAAGPGEIEAIQTLLASRGIRVRFNPDAEQAARDAASAQSASLGQLRSWLLHPDERVPLAVRKNKALTRGRYSSYIDESLNLRAIRTSIKEGIVWSPIHDAIGGPSTYRTPDQYRKEIQKEVGPDALTTLPHRLSLGALEEYLSSTSNPTLVDLLLDFRSHALADIVAKAAGGLMDHQLARLLAGEGPYGVLVEYCRGNTIPDHHRERIRRWMIDGIDRAVRRNSLKLARWYSRLIGPLRIASLAPDTVDQLIARAERASPRVRDALLLHLNGLRPLSTEQSARLAELSIGGSANLGALIRRNPNISTETLVRIAQHCSNPTLREQLADLLAKRESLELTAALAASNSREVQKLILAHGTGPGFQAVLQDVLANTNMKERRDCLHAAFLTISACLRKTLPKPDYATYPRVLSGDCKSIEEFASVLSDLPYSDPFAVPEWVITWPRKNPLEALLMLRRVWRSVVTPEETALLMRSQNPQIRSLVLVSLGDITIGPPSTPEQLRRLRRSGRRRR